MANTTSTRFTNGANQDQTFRVLNWDYQTPTIASAGGTVSIDTSNFFTEVNLGVLPSNPVNIKAIGLTATVAVTQISDELVFLGIGPATGTCSVIFGSDFKVQTSNTITVAANANLKAQFIYNGTYWVGNGFSA